MRYLYLCFDILVMQKNDLTRKLWLISIFMTSQAGQKIIITLKLPNISRRKGNQYMKFCQLIKYNMRNIFLQILCRKWGTETSSWSLFIFLKKLCIRWKQVVSTLGLINFRRPRLRHTINTKFISFQTVGSEICSIVTFYYRVWD